MTPRQKLAAGATSLFLLAGAALYMGTLTATGDGTGLYGEVTLDDVPTPTTCVYREGYAAPATLGLWVPDYVGGDAYAMVRVCVDEEALEDEAEEPLLPPEYAALPGQDTIPPEAYVDGPNIQIWVQGHENAPFACACSAGPACTWRGTRTGIYGLTFSPGTWTGEDCHRKPCSEWAGLTSWPSQCPLKAPQ